MHKERVDEFVKIKINAALGCQLNRELKALINKASTTYELNFKNITDYTYNTRNTNGCVATYLEGAYLRMVTVEIDYTYENGIMTWDVTKARLNFPINLVYKREE